MADSKDYPFSIMNRRTGETVGQYKSMQTARSARDRHDTKYGSYVHTIVPTAPKVDTDSGD